MKIEEFQRLVLHLSNQSYVRYWLWWKLSKRFDNQMVLCIGNIDGDNNFYQTRLENLDKELEEKGFEKIFLGNAVYYAVERSE